MIRAIEENNTLKYLQKFNTNILHYTSLFSVSSPICFGPDLLANFRESSMTYAVYTPTYPLEFSQVIKLLLFFNS
jgi:hypothetical protein